MTFGKGILNLDLCLVGHVGAAFGFEGAAQGNRKDPREEAPGQPVNRAFMCGSQFEPASDERCK
jgi:hypothetical protein